MSPLVWLAIPALATLLAIAWASWSTRARGPEEALDSVAAYERFRAALSASAVAPGPADAADRR